MLRYGNLIITLTLVLAFTSLLYLGLYSLFTRWSVLKRLSGSGKSLWFDKSIEARMLIKKSPIAKRGNPSKVEMMLSRASVNMEVHRFFKVLSLLGLIIALLAWLITHSIILAFSSLLLEPVLVYAGLKRLEQKRLKIIMTQLPDLIDALSMSIKSGYSVLQAINLIAEGKNEPIAHEFDLVLQDINVGKSYDEAFDAMVLRNPIEDLEIMTTAILISKETGGNLAVVLDTVAETIRERERLREQIKSLTAQGKLSGIVLSLLPIAVMGLLFLINPSYIRLLFTHPLGKAMLLCGVVSQIIGFLVIRSIVKIEG